MQQTDDRIAFSFLLVSVFCIAFSIAAGELGLILCLLFTAVHLGRSRRKPAWTSAASFALAFVAIALLAGILGTDPARSLHSARRLVWLTAIVLSATLVSDSRRLNLLWSFFAAGTAVLCLRRCVEKPLAAWNDWEAGIPGASDFWSALVNRGSMTDGQMLVVGAVVALGLFFAARREGKTGRAWLGLLAFQVLALILNFKRGAWITALLFATAFVLFAQGRRVLKYALLLVLAIVAASAALPPVRARVSEIRQEFTLDRGGRWAMWFQIAPRLIRDHPWGIGYGAMTNDMMREIAPQVERNRDHLHSNIAQVLVETGWLGLWVYLGWMARTAVAGVRYVRLTASAAPREKLAAVTLLFAFLALVANGLVEYNFGDTELLVVYCAIMGSTDAALRWIGARRSSP
jgi:O-antigen ligase